MQGLVVLGAAAPRDSAIRLSCIRNTRLPMHETPVLNIGAGSLRAALGFEYWCQSVQNAKPCPSTRSGLVPFQTRHQQRLQDKFHLFNTKSGRFSTDIFTGAVSLYPSSRLCVVVTERDDGATGFALVMQNSGKLALPVHGRDPFK